MQFLYISRGSLYELETHLNIAVMVEIPEQEAFIKESILIDECLRLLNGLINRYETDSSLQ